MSALRQVLGGLLALLLVGGAMAASGVLAFTEQGTPVAQVESTATFTLPPATLAPTASATRPTATITTRPSATATLTSTPSASPTALPTDTRAPTDTDTASPEPTATLVPVTLAPTATPCIPAPPAGWVVYVIQRGDTLSNLAVGSPGTELEFAL